MIFPVPVVNKLRKLEQRARQMRTRRDVSICLKELQDLLCSPSLDNVVQEVKNKNAAQRNQLLVLRDEIERDYNDLEDQLFQEYGAHEGLSILSVSTMEHFNSLERFLEWRQTTLTTALSAVLVDKEAPAPEKSRLEILLGQLGCEDSFTKRFIVDRLETSFVVAWKREYQLYKITSATIDHLSLINRHTMGIGQSDAKHLMIAVQNVSKYILQTIEQTSVLTILPIDYIFYSFMNNKKDSKKSYLMLQVNNQSKPVRVEGVRSVHLHLLLVNPYEDIDVCDNFEKEISAKEKSRENDRVRKSFEAINAAFCKEYYRYGFIYGHKALIHSDGYYHRINPEFAELIKKL